VDNPHTKPLRFWQWLIAEVKRRFPETVFLSEAFTRPRVMYALAKVGFDQSYTYFTWRNSKPEIVEYFTELTRTDVREFFRPNLFTNTPDILPEYLQYGGRPAFMARLVLAATLGASYGIYSGFELCEHAARPGTEEYLDSEKYEIKHRDWTQRGNLRAYIARINAIRRENPALLANDRLRFHPVDNEQLICFSKSTPDLTNVVTVVVNLDPHNVHAGWVDIPIEELGIGPEESYQAHDLIGDGRYLWHGRRNYVQLDPAQSPAQVYRIRHRVRTERDFDYFL
jgi:starch synthase (maltosyl-transferring)